MSTGPQWRKSSHSHGDGNCAEVAVVPGGDGYLIAVRDSKDRSGGTLTFTPADWLTFTGHIKAGKYAVA